ncbi:unnamed protein product [Thelazia callipaeda]|uniref:CCHC-type domain-containing protein n=1 Tax=Thelazia callipaeda TaxID=103827 RepID=A0A0N5CQB8_THECL|nr:unnamed protein product [Thelazia callipaeda]
MTASEETTGFGTCKWFNVLRGYGFITPDDGGDDIFVHQSSLFMDGFRSLDTGERVRFDIRIRNKGKEAVKVTSAEPDGKLRGSSIKPFGKSKSHYIRCYKCGLFGNHIAAKCKTGQGFDKLCYKCHKTDHLIADCPQRSYAKNRVEDQKVKQSGQPCEEETQTIKLDSDEKRDLHDNMTDSSKCNATNITNDSNC